MEWFWGIVIIFLFFLVLLALRYCEKQCKVQPDYRRSQPDNHSTTPAPPGFTVANQRVPLRVQETPVSMPMPRTGLGTVNMFSFDEVTRNNPYPPTLPTSRIPSAPVNRQLSSSAEDLPPSYNDVISANLQRPHSAGNVNI